MRSLDLQQSLRHGTDGLANYLERKFLRTLQFMGERQAVRFARAVAPLFTYSRNRRRRQNLERFFGSPVWNDTQLENLERNYYNYLARLFAEQACLAENPSEFRERVTLCGATHVEDALRLGRGALVVSGHIGNYRFIPAVLAQQGYNVTALVRSLPLAENERYFNRLAAKYNLRVVFTYQNVIETCRAVLRNNGIIYIAFDTVAWTTLRCGFLSVIPALN